MKKLILLFTIFITTGIIVHANFNNEISPDFITALNKCKPYTYKSKPIEILGIQVQNTKKIIGVKNSLCHYAELSNLQGTKCITKCKFNRVQLSQFVSSLRNLETNEQLNGNNTSSQIISKFYNNPDICTTICK